MLSLPHCWRAICPVVEGIEHVDWIGISTRSTFRRSHDIRARGMDTPEVQRAQDKTDGVIVVLDDLEQIDIKSLGILGIVAHEK